MRKITVIILTFFISLNGFSQKGIAFENLGFTIKSLEPSLEEIKGNYIALSMFLPVSKEFAPNVNVMIQDYSGTIEEYKKLTDDQFVSIGANILRSDLKNGVLIIEYTSDKMAAYLLHVYTKVYIKNGKAFLSTATATTKQWELYKRKLREVVESIDSL